MKKERIYEMCYDNPLKTDGTPKQNKLLGIFEISQIIEEDNYSSIKIGIRNGKKYLIIEKEASYGTKTKIYKL